MNDVMPGVFIGIVVENKLSDDCKIGIKLPDVLGDEIIRARVSGFLAGNKYGSLFLPEKDELVLVAFLKNSLQDPVIIGSIWSQKDEAPDANSNGENNLKVIKTRNENEICLSDETDKEKIEIKTKGGNEIRLSGEKDKEIIELLNGSTKISIEKKDNKITIESSDGNISITGNEITITAKQKITLDGNVYVTKTLDIGPDSGPKTHIDQNNITGL
jgi:uncharacterized protein involved in type VI secretion and phage assembly